MKITICTSEFVRAFYISMIQKMKTFCSLAQSKATRKVIASDRSKPLKRQGKCMRLLVTCKLKTIGESYRAIKSRNSGDGTGN